MLVANYAFLWTSAVTGNDIDFNYLVNLIEPKEYLLNENYYENKWCVYLFETLTSYLDILHNLCEKLSSGQLKPNISRILSYDGALPALKEEYELANCGKTVIRIS